MLEFKLCKFQLQVRFIVYHIICNCLLLISKIYHNDKIIMSIFKWHFKRRDILDLKKQCIDDWLINAQTYRYLEKNYNNISDLPISEIKEKLLSIYPEIKFNKKYV